MAGRVGGGGECRHQQTDEDGPTGEAVSEKGGQCVAAWTPQGPGSDSDVRPAGSAAPSPGVSGHRILWQTLPAATAENWGQRRSGILRLGPRGELAFFKRYQRSVAAHLREVEVLTTAAGRAGFPALLHHAPEREVWAVELAQRSVEDLSRPPPLLLTGRVLGGVLEGLDFLHHDLGLRHGQLCPAHVLLRSSGEAFLSGLGQMRSLDAPPGEPGPYAPWSPPTGPGVDLFSLGALAAFLLTGRDPSSWLPAPASARSSPSTPAPRPAPEGSEADDGGAGSWVDGEGGDWGGLGLGEEGVPWAAAPGPVPDHFRRLVQLSLGVRWSRTSAPRLLRLLHPSAAPRPSATSAQPLRLLSHRPPPDLQHSHLL